MASSLRITASGPISALIYRMCLLKAVFLDAPEPMCAPFFTILYSENVERAKFFCHPALENIFFWNFRLFSERV